MAHPVLLGILGGALVAKLILRRRFAHRHCGDGRRFGRFGRRGVAPRDVETIRLADLAGGLELNERQAQDANEVFQLIGRAGLQGEQLRTVLGLVASDSYQSLLIEEELGIDEPSPRDRELLDGLEHLHNILTPEQREKLHTFARA
jgi:hypothetical protein